MPTRNPGFAKLQSNYLFLEIANRKKAYLEENPNKKLISLGIGDTTEPLVPSCVSGLIEKAKAMGTREGYCGYPDYNGSELLRSHIAKYFYDGRISADEIFISDGSKPDLARMQLLFHKNTRIAVQDPVYPAYVDGTVITGKGGDYNAERNTYSEISYLRCNEANGFWPEMSEETMKEIDVIFICSPNNPTGTVATYEQLMQLVQDAKKFDFFILFDSAYAQYIVEPDLPKSIFEIPGSLEVAMETSSFSKIYGFTGVRLGWTVFPRALKYKSGESVRDDWVRCAGTFFNGPSTLSEAAALSCLSTEQAREEIRGIISYYLENAKQIRTALTEVGFTCHGGINCPYVWVYTSTNSWEMFDLFMREMQIVITPGTGFGNEGKSYVRISGFAHRENVQEALKRIQTYFKQNKIHLA